MRRRLRQRHEKTMRTFIVSLVATLLAPAAAMAQHIELQPFVGLRFGGGFTVQQTVPGGQRPVTFTFDDGLTWGGTVGFALWERAVVEFLFSRHETALRAEPLNAGKELLFNAAATQYGGNVLIYWADTGVAIRPYIMLGASATSIAPDVDVDGVTKGSFSFGGGVTAFVSPGLGLRVQLRYTPTYVTQTPELLCGSSCFHLDVANYMHQGELAAGVVFRF